MKKGVDTLVNASWPSPFLKKMRTLLFDAVRTCLRLLTSLIVLPFILTPPVKIAVNIFVSL